MEMSQTNTLTHGQIIEMLNSTKSNMQITAEIMQTYDLLKFASARYNGSSFLLITQYKMSVINKSETTKRSKDRQTNGKCTNGTNCRSRVWRVFFIYQVLGVNNFHFYYRNINDEFPGIFRHDLFFFF